MNEKKKAMMMMVRVGEYWKLVRCSVRLLVSWFVVDSKLRVVIFSIASQILFLESHHPINIVNIVT
jgi:hypothetical protein